VRKGFYTILSPYSIGSIHGLLTETTNHTLNTRFTTNIRCSNNILRIKLWSYRM